MYFKCLVGKKFFFCFKLNYCPTQIPIYAAPHLVVVEYLNALPPCLSVCQSEVSFLRSTCVKAGWSAGRGRFHLSQRSSCHLWSSNSILRTIKPTKYWKPIQNSPYIWANHLNMIPRSAARSGKNDLVILFLHFPQNTAAEPLLALGNSYRQWHTTTVQHWWVQQI